MELNRFKLIKTFRLLIPLFLCVPLTQSSFSIAAANKKEDEKKEPPRVKLPHWKFNNIYKNVTDLTKYTQKEKSNATGEILDLLKASKGTDLAKIGEIFQKHSFEAVEKIAKSKSIPDAQSGELSRLRREMINQAMAEAIKEVDPKKQLTIGMLDSGNKNSGIASDVDQTVFVIPKDAAQKLGIDEAKVIDAFNKKFKSMFNVHPARLGIESMNGADFFPDWRERHSSGSTTDDVDRMMYGDEADRVTGEKRKNPEAYRSEGQLKSQAEGRGYESLQEHHQRVSDLRSAQDQIENLKKSTSLSESEKQNKIKKVQSELLKKYKKTYPSSSIDELAKKISKDSPWTEVTWEKGQPVASQLNDPKNKVLKNQPETGVKRFAFDGSWDNWLMYEHHKPNSRKYLLRSFAEGISLMRKQVAGQPLTTLEYEKIYASGDEAQLKNVLADVYKGKDAATLERYKKALDVSAKERLRHKGVKNPSTGADYTLKEVWSQYWPVVSEAEAKMYADMPKAAFEKMLLERAVRNWEADGREIMMENLVRTISAPADLLNGRISDAEFKRIKAKFPNATRAKLETAVRKQLYHGIHDLISIEHAKALVEEAKSGKKSKTPRQTDLVDRMIQKLGGENSELGKEVKAIALEAAQRRIAIEPGERSARREYFDFIHRSLKEKFDDVKSRTKGTAEAFKQAKLNYLKGVYTPEYVSTKLMRATGERWGSLKAHGKDIIGFEKVKSNMLIPVKGPIDIPVEKAKYKWQAKKLFKNMAIGGNADSVVQVMYAYQTGGSEAAAWAAGFEVMMNFPPIAKLNAVKDLVVHKEPRGVVMMGSAMMVPALGQAYLLVSLGTTSVKLLGNFILEPLKNDNADKLYQGFLDTSSGFKKIERSQRVGLLHFVPKQYLQVKIKAPEDAKGPDGKPIKDTDVVFYKTYTKEEADKRFNVFSDQYDKFVKKGILSSGKNWDSNYEKIKDDIANPKGYFESQRISMYAYYRDPKRPFARSWQNLMAALKKSDYELDETEAFQFIVKFFMGRIDDWINAKGEFSAFDENITISRRFEDKALRQRIAYRSAADLVRSYQVIKSVEDTIYDRVQQVRQEEKNQELLAMMQALQEAWGIEDPEEFLVALEGVHQRRKLSERTPNKPRIKIRPSIISDVDHDGNEVHKIDYFVSITAAPEDIKDPSNFYSDIQYTFNPISEFELEIVADVGAYFDKEKKHLIGKRETIEIGKINTETALPDRQDFMVIAGKITEKVPPKKPIDRMNDKEVREWQRENEERVTEPFEDQKATMWGRKWGEDKVLYLIPQLWIRWKDAPLESFFFYELSVTGGSPKYEYEIARQISGQIRLPIQEGDPYRPNAFVIQIPWPEGHAGSFDVKGKIHAYSEFATSDTWKSLKPTTSLTFSESFQIADERETTEVKIMVAAKKLSPPEKASGVETPSASPSKQPRRRRRRRHRRRSGHTIPDTMKNYTYQQTFLPWDPLSAEPFGQRWGKDYIRTPKPQLWINWKDTPPKKSYYYELSLVGGYPPFQYEKTGWVFPRDKFPPFDKKEKRLPGTYFVIPMPYPFKRGGAFEIEGKLSAYDKRFRDEDLEREEPIDSFSFRKIMQINYFTRSGEGTASISASGNAHGKLQLSNIQEGQRIGKVSGGGNSVYTMLDKGLSRSTSFILPKAGMLKSVTLTFEDFGRMVDLTLPITSTQKKPLKVSASNCASKAQERIDQTRKSQPYNWGFISHLMEKRSLCYSHNAAGSEPTDYGQWKAAYVQYLNQKKKWIDVIMNTGWVGYKGKKISVKPPDTKHGRSVPYNNGQYQDQIIKKLTTRKKQAMTSLYGGYFHLSGVAGTVGNYAEAMNYSTQALGLVPQDVPREYSRIQKMHLERLALYIFRGTGDAAKAHEYWLQAVALGKQLANNPDTYRPPPSPYLVDEVFKLQVK